MGRTPDDVPRQAARNLLAAKVSREARGPVDVFSSASTAPAAATCIAPSRLAACCDRAFDYPEMHIGISFSVTLVFFLVALHFACWIVRSGWRIMA